MNDPKITRRPQGTPEIIYFNRTGTNLTDMTLDLSHRR